jgi:hypothetical protein
MRTSYPYITLMLLLGAAVAIFVGGSRLSRRVEIERIARDREPLRLFARSMQDELNRLERLYEAHLCRMARSTPVDSNIKVQMACNWLLGLRQVSILPTQPNAAKAPLHVTIDANDGNVNPRPAFLGMERAGGLKVPVVVLPDEVRHAEGNEFGWLDQPGSPPLFWYRRTEETCLVLTVDREAVAGCMNQWMRSWVQQHFVPVEAKAGGDTILGPREFRLAATGICTQKVTRLPDFVLPMNQRFGSWQLLSWDGFQQRQTSHVPILAGSAALALLVGLLGIGIFVQQRRATRLEITGGAEDPCVFDPDAFAQILTNLVSNVEKYAAEGGYLGIQAFLEGSQLTVTVADHGSGIPAAEAEKIFRPFYRLHNEVKEGATGTGLGLSIAHELALRMGGALRLLPSDKGAVFEMTIPVQAEGDRAGVPVVLE